MILDVGVLETGAGGERYLSKKEGEDRTCNFCSYRVWVTPNPFKIKNRVRVSVGVLRIREVDFIALKSLRELELGKEKNSPGAYPGDRWFDSIIRYSTYFCANFCGYGGNCRR